MKLVRRKSKISRKTFSMIKRTFTYHTRISPNNLDLLNSYAELFCQTERELYAEFAKGKNIRELKSKYLPKKKITARQFNAICMNLEAAIDSLKKLQKKNIEELKEKISNQEKKLKKLRGKKRFLKNRSLQRRQTKLKKLEKLQAEGKISKCFGKKKLFRKQFQTENQTEWKTEWQKARNNRFFVLGSKDETAGNQSCTMSFQEDGKITLRLRLPDALNHKYLYIKDVEFKYGKKEIEEAHQSNLFRKELQKQKNSSYKYFGQAINYLFRKDEKGWKVFVSISMAKEIRTKPLTSGAIGIDINIDHLALSEVDHFGNLIYRQKIPLNLYGKNKNSSKAQIENAAKEIVELAKLVKKPIAIENLSFEIKKKQLKSKRLNRTLSGFAYAHICEAIRSRAWKDNIEVKEVNPAYTSFIGSIKYARRYGMSNHEAAALCIGRRSLGFSEKLPLKTSRLLGLVPVRNPSLDNWKMFKAAHEKNRVAHEELLKVNTHSILETKIQEMGTLKKVGRDPLSANR